jgi:uncharacterized protein
MLQEKEKTYLLKLARESVLFYLKENRLLNVEAEIQEIFSEGGSLSSLLFKRLGCFVTFKTKSSDSLRGCIGIIESEERLYRNVVEYAVLAATKDPRFPVIVEGELENLDIEISVMGEVKKLEGLNDIVIGTHGLIVERDYFRGLLLPQVAQEYGWDQKLFLEQTCLKAGLSIDALEDKETKLFFFDSFCFSEKK